MSKQAPQRSASDSSSLSSSQSIEQQLESANKGSKETHKKHRRSRSSSLRRKKSNSRHDRETKSKHKDRHKDKSKTKDRESKKSKKTKKKKSNDKKRSKHSVSPKRDKDPPPSSNPTPPPVPPPPPTGTVVLTQLPAHLQGLPIEWGTAFRPSNPYVSVKANKSGAPPPGAQILPLEIPLSLDAIDRRRRERSRSPLDYYRRTQDTSNQTKFWDSFTWNSKINYTDNLSATTLINTRKMRRLMITNIPYEIGITEDDLRALITTYMAKHYLKDEVNNCPVADLEMKEAEHIVEVQLSSIEETCRICNLDKIELFTGWSNRIVRLGDSCYGSNVVSQAKTAAQAQAAAFAAISIIQNKKANFTMDSGLTYEQTSTILRVTNAVTPYLASKLSKAEWNEYEIDLLQGFSSFGKIVHSWFVKKSASKTCADAGNMFIEFQTKEIAEKAFDEMEGTKYDQREVKIYFVPRQIYYKHFRPDVTPPVLPEPQTKKKANVGQQNPGGQPSQGQSAVNTTTTVTPHNLAGTTLTGAVGTTIVTPNSNPITLQSSTQGLPLLGDIGTSQNPNTASSVGRQEESAMQAA